jgi:hypothetical protein
MHSVIKWGIDNLSYMALAALATSVLSVIVAVIQVRDSRKESLRRSQAEEAKLVREMARSLSATISGQTSTGSPEKRKDVLAPSGQEHIPMLKIPVSESMQGSAA